METQNVAKSPNDKLPRVLSKLIRLAVEDLKNVLSQPDKFEVDMTFWVRHGLNYDERSRTMIPAGKCVVCLAGSVMVGSMGLLDEIEEIIVEEEQEEVGPTCLQDHKLISENDAMSLSALNHCRLNRVDSALRFVGGEDSLKGKSRAFWQSINDISDHLESKYGPLSRLSQNDPWVLAEALLEMADRLEKMGL